MMLPPSVLFSAITDGRAYFVNEIHTIPADSTGNAHISNVASADKPVWLVDMSVITRKQSEIRLYDWFESITNGAGVGIQNLKMDSESGPPDGGDFSAYKNSDFTSADGSYPIGKTSSGPPSTNTTVVYPTQIEPDRDLIVEVENTDTAEATVVITMLLLESY